MRRGLRGPDLKMLSLNVMRSFLPGAPRRAQFRVDIINATDSNFGRITTVNGSTMRL
jgi:hypothetical protein